MAAPKKKNKKTSSVSFFISNYGHTCKRYISFQKNMQFFIYTFLEAKKWSFVFSNLQQPAAAKRGCCNVYFWFIFARSIIKSPHFVFLLRKKWLFYKKSLIAKFHQSCCNMRQFAATFFIFEPGTPSGWKEHVKMYQNPKFHIVCQIWSLYMKNVINPVYHDFSWLNEHVEWADFFFVVNLWSVATL